MTIIKKSSIIASMQKLNSIPQRILSVDLRRGAPVIRRIVGRHLTKIRERIILRDGAACRKCGKMVGRLEVHHEKPLHLGGAESDENRMLLCVACHRILSDAECKERQ